MIRDPFDVAYNHYAEDVSQLANPLAGLSLQLLDKFGGFLPHGLVLGLDDEVTMVGAQDGSIDETNAADLLPALHDGLRQTVREGGIRAVATAEMVQIAPDGTQMVDAIKVLFENVDGFCTAVYVPYEKDDDGTHEPQQALLVEAEGEIVTDWIATLQ